jgi:formylmethanofuran dehydrogenase subunit E
MKVTEIGKVINKHKYPVDSDEMKKTTSVIEIREEFADGLDKIENYKYLQIVFYFNQSEDYNLIGSRRKGLPRGLFASRSSRRPSPLGITTVELLKREGNHLSIYGLDAIDQTPVVDIKPYTAFMDDQFLSLQKETPRYEINKMIKYQNRHELLLKSGELHGHFCPYLALGVMAAADGLNKLGLINDGMEDVMAVVETNSCFSDGIQFAAGTTFGNNSLIYRDFGKTAVTFLGRNNPENNIRYYLANNDFITEDYPEAEKLFKKVIKERNGSEEESEEMKELWQKIAFSLIEKDPENYFKIEKNIDIALPDYAPIFEDKHCSKCQEKLMAAKAIERNNKILCQDCADSSYFQLEGSGIIKKVNKL